MRGFSALLDRLLGRGDATVTLPTLDGPLLPNQDLESATSLVAHPAADNVIVHAGRVLFSSGSTLHALDCGSGTTASTLRNYAGTISALAADGHEALAVCIEGDGIAIEGGRHDGARIAALGALPPSAVTAALWLDSDTLIVAVGGIGRRMSDWRRDLMERGASGSVWKIDCVSGRQQCLADGLAWPVGLAQGAGDVLYVAESWRHRICSLSLRGTGRPAPVLDDLPAYPWRISPAAGGGYWLAFASVRNQLVEFILREPRFCRRMLAEVPEAYWMAPALASGVSFKEPMQGSQLKQLGVMKPWAVTRSYGLIARCDAQFSVQHSHHSRADGSLHGITAVCEFGSDLLIAAQGAGRIVRLPATPMQSVRNAA